MLSRQIIQWKSHTLNKLLTDVKGSPESSMIETLVIRTMQKANYSTKYRTLWFRV
jgi:exoribonuclease R